MGKVAMQFEQVMALKKVRRGVKEQERLRYSRCGREEKARTVEGCSRKRRRSATRGSKKLMVDRIRAYPVTPSDTHVIVDRDVLEESKMLCEREELRRKEDLLAGETKLDCVNPSSVGLDDVLLQGNHPPLVQQVVHWRGRSHPREERTRKPRRVVH